MLLMKFDFEAMRDAHGIMGPFFFVLFIILVVIFLMNILITIINEALADADEDIPPSEDQVIVDYMMEQLISLLPHTSIMVSGKAYFQHFL